MVSKEIFILIKIVVHFLANLLFGFRYATHCALNDLKIFSIFLRLGYEKNAASKSVEVIKK
jgi:hypothetical protein